MPSPENYPFYSEVNSGEETSAMNVANSLPLEDSGSLPIASLFDLLASGQTNTVQVPNSTGLTLGSVPGIEEQIPDKSSLAPDNFMQTIDQLLEELSHTQFIDAPSTPPLDSTHEICSYAYDTLQPTDPLRFVESKAGEGKRAGAIKLSLGRLHGRLLKAYLHLHTDSFMVRAKKVVFNPPLNELHDRLAFYKELIKCHFPLGTKRAENFDPVVKLEPGITESEEVEPQKHQEYLLKSQSSNEVPLTPVSASLDSALPSSLTLENNTTVAFDKSQNGLAHWKIPTIENRQLDLYSLYFEVIRRGRKSEVDAKRLWPQVADELSYSKIPKVVEALSCAYLKYLYPFELENRKSETGVNTGEPPIKSESIEVSNVLPKTAVTEIPNASLNEILNGIPYTCSHSALKRNEFAVPSKKQKLCNSVPLLLGSANEFGRSVKAKTAKGILLNSTCLKEDNEGKFLSVINGDGLEKSNDKIRALVPEVDVQLINYLDWLTRYMALFTDTFPLQLSGPDKAILTLSEVMKNDSQYRKTVLESISAPNNSEKNNSETLETKALTGESLEMYLWSMIETGRFDGKTFFNGIVVPVGYNSIGSVCPRFGIINHEDSVPRESQIQNSKIVSSGNDSYPQNNASDDYELSLHLFNPRNTPFLPNSVLGALAGSDLDSRQLTSVCLNVGTTFSIENWKCEDHFTQCCDYLVAGAWKRWYFIPELDFDKFEKLVEETNSYSDSRLHINNQSVNPEIEQLLKLFLEGQVEAECLGNILENVNKSLAPIRLPMGNSNFQQLIALKGRKSLMNQDFFITPLVLQQHGIKYTTTIQKPGDIVYKYPQTYSCAISFGVNISERVNFASKLWLNYSLAAETWLAQQSLLPNFLVFRLFVNLAQELDSPDKSLHFDSEIYSAVLQQYSEMLDNELRLRQQIRKRAKVKEVTLDEKAFLNIDCISDLDFLIAFPTKVVANLGSHVFTFSATNFLEHLDSVESGACTADFSKEGAKFELHLFYSDEKLRAFRRLFQEYSMDYETWQARYMELVAEGNVSLRSYKALLVEGQKIVAALSSVSKSYLRFTGEDPPKDAEEQQRYGTIAQIETFTEQVSDLKTFVDEANEVVEQCQAILSLKHQQRIRNGAADTVPEAEGRDSLKILVDLTNQIPKLNFRVPEFEQVFEFCYEIQSFDRACRQLLAQSSVTMADVKDMVSLGSSFGVPIPLLLFLIRLKDKLEWTKVYDIIVTGGDPFSGKKEIFLFQDLEKFRESGLSCLAASDLDKLQVIDTYLAKGSELDRQVQEYIAKNRLLNDVKLIELDKIMNDIEERLKLSGSDRLFVRLDTYQKLVDLKSQEAHIRFLQDFTFENHGLFDVRQTLLDLKSVLFEVKTASIDAAVSQSEEWLERVETGLLPIRTRRKIVNASNVVKRSCCPRLAARLNTIVENCKTVCCDLQMDSIENSSAYMFYHGTESTEGVPIRYCTCRDFEDGAMIECDRCHEWFHFSCVSETGNIGENEDDKYACPSCLILELFMTSSLSPVIKGSIPESLLLELISSGESLLIQPLVELSLLQELAETVRHFKKWAFVLAPQEVGAMDRIIIDEFMFRKAVGCPVAVASLLEIYLKKLSSVAKATLLEPHRNSDIEIAADSVRDVALAVDAIDPQMPSMNPRISSNSVTLRPLNPTGTVANGKDVAGKDRGEVDDDVTLSEASTIESGQQEGPRFFQAQESILALHLVEARPVPTKESLEILSSYTQTVTATSENAPTQEITPDEKADTELRELVPGTEKPVLSETQLDSIIGSLEDNHGNQEANQGVYYCYK